MKKENGFGFREPRWEFSNPRFPIMIPYPGNVGEDFFTPKDTFDEIFFGTNGFENFPLLEDRLKPFVISSKICEYLTENNISSVIFVDEAARTAFHGLRAFWQLKSPDQQKMPFNAYFINPRGFLTEKDLNSRRLGISRRSREEGLDLLKELSDVHQGKGRSKKEIMDDFVKTYPNLMRVNDGPVLVYDNCIHNGETLKPILKILKELNFQDVRIGVATDGWNRSGIKPNFVALYSKDKNCYVFGKDELVRKPYDSVHSVINPEGKVNGDRLRYEIGVAVKNPFEGKCTPLSQMRHKSERGHALPDALMDFVFKDVLASTAEMLERKAMTKVKAAAFLASAFAAFAIWTAFENSGFLSGVALLGLTAQTTALNRNINEVIRIRKGINSLKKGSRREPGHSF